MDFKKRFGDRLREARENMKMSQQELAAKIDGGISQSQLSKYESGEAMPRPGRVIRFAEFLGVSEGWLRGLYPNDEKENNVQNSSQNEEVKALQESELIWQRRELEAQREIVELKRKLVDQESLFVQFRQALTDHLSSLEKVLESLEGEERATLLNSRAKLLEEIGSPPSQMDASTQLRKTLADLGEVFSPGA